MRKQHRNPFLSRGQVSVESFERINLHMRVLPKPGSYEQAFKELLGTRAREGKLEPTLIYTNTTKEVDEIVSWFNARFPVSDDEVPIAGAYHAKLSNGNRREAHTAFMRDDHEIMVASVAYGECVLAATSCGCY